MFSDRDSEIFQKIKIFELHRNKLYATFLVTEIKVVTIRTL